MNDEFNTLLAEMQADFLDELPERCDRIEQGVMALERKEADAFNELYRQVHSLKGAGGMFGVPVITTICHQFETFVSEVHDRFDQQASSTALAYVDLLRKTAKPAGRDAAGVAAIEQVLDRMRVSTLSGRLSVLLVEPSEAMRKLYNEVFADKPVQLVTLGRGLEALERMLHEPFDLLVASRELPDLNAIALMAAVRESDCRNKNIQAILVSSNPAPVPKHLNIRATVRRDPKLVPTLSQHVLDVLAQPRKA
jgi:chemotaxis protein histidine kinase CheA